MSVTRKAKQQQPQQFKFGGASDKPKSAMEEFVLKGIDPSDDSESKEESHSNEKKEPPLKKEPQKEQEDDPSDDDDDNGGEYAISRLLKKAKEEKEPEEEESTKPDDKKTPEKKEEKKQEPDTSDFDPESFDPESVVTASGKPVSSASKDVFKKFKATAAKRQEEITRLKAELDEIKKKSPTESEDYKKLQDDYKKYKEIVDSKYFEESPEFSSTFVAPIDKKYKRVGELITDLAKEGIITDRNSNIIRENLIKFDAAVREGKRGAIYSAIAAIEDEVDGPAGKAIAKEIEEFIPLYEKYRIAVKDKEEARKLIERETGDRVGGTLKNFNLSLKSIEDDFMEKQKDRIAFLRSDPIKDIIQFDELYGAAKKEAQDAIRSFATSGEMNSKLVSLLHKASLHAVNEREIQTQASTISAFHKRINEQESEIKSLKEQIGKIRKLKNKGTFQYSDDEEDDEEDDSNGSSFGRSAIAQAIRAQAKAKR